MPDGVVYISLSLPPPFCRCRAAFQDPSPFPLLSTSYTDLCTTSLFLSTQGPPPHPVTPSQSKLLNLSIAVVDDSDDDLNMTKYVKKNTPGPNPRNQQLRGERSRNAYVRLEETGAKWVWPSQQCPRGRGCEGLGRTRAPLHRSLTVVLNHIPITRNPELTTFCLDPHAHHTGP